ncbi:protein translocase SEC61 complex subunit gamma [Candidatus Woesearchaeota archaeon]|nr:protein translocase SEC61 complex subunit gamma [Candidatus Woesearchaeota archaeon]
MEETISTPGKIRSYWQECIRVLKVTRKPSMFEFKTIVKVSGLGMALIGIIGFLIQLMKELF